MIDKLISRLFKHLSDHSFLHLPPLVFIRNSLQHDTIRMMTIIGINLVPLVPVQLVQQLKILQLRFRRQIRLIRFSQTQTNLAENLGGERHPTAQIEMILVMGRVRCTRIIVQA